MMPGLDAGDLRQAGFEDCFTELEDSVSSEEDVAVVGPPFGGKEALLDHVADREGAERRSLSSLDAAPDLPAGRTVVIDDCHYLFRRRIDGFDRLDAFLDAVLDADVPVVTSWNRYAWNYLVQVRAVDRVFSRQVAVPKIGRSEVAALVDGDVTFVDDREEGSSSITGTGRAMFRLAGRTFEVPYPVINMETIRTWREADEPIEEVIHGRVATLGDGIPGVVRAVWEASVEDGRIGTKTLYEPPKLEISDRDARVLQSLVFNEWVGHDELAGVLDVDRLDTVLRTLEHRELVRWDDEEGIGPEPAALPAIIDELERRRLVW
ncbi:MAG: hypothetical protein SVU32_08430 [Candidatus Nanohaloarchaea archaeon]|nr:hypothetical protein [Candidatus Nanohaloarchaea archaeon]